MAGLRAGMAGLQAGMVGTLFDVRWLSYSSRGSRGREPFTENYQRMQLCMKPMHNRNSSCSPWKIMKLVWLYVARNGNSKNGILHEIQEKRGSLKVRDED